MIRGRDLRAARQATRVSLGKLAQRIGRDKGHLSRVERELDAREVTPALVRDYERVLGITIIPADNAARDLGLNSIEPSDSGAAGIAPSSLPSQYAGDGVLLHLRVNDREVIVPLSRRTVLAGGLGSMLDVFSVDLGADEVAALTDPTKARRLTITSQAHLDEVLVHLRDQWHALVKTDNLLGPRFAIMGVRHQIAIIDSILSDLHHSVRKTSSVLAPSTLSRPRGCTRMSATQPARTTGPIGRWSGPTRATTGPCWPGSRIDAPSRLHSATTRLEQSASRKPHAETRNNCRPLCEPRSGCRRRKATRSLETSRPHSTYLTRHTLGQAWTSRGMRVAVTDRSVHRATSRCIEPTCG